MKRILSISIIAAITAIATNVASYICGYNRGCKNSGIALTLEENADTLCLADTILFEEPVYIAERYMQKVPYIVKDTAVIHDTVYVYLSREQREYGDDSYHAWVSGVDPSLDSIRIYRKEQIVTNYIDRTVKERPKWSLGIGAGAGVAICGTTVKASPYIGLTISYNLLSW